MSQISRLAANSELIRAKRAVVLEETFAISPVQVFPHADLGCSVDCFCGCPSPTFGQGKMPSDENGAAQALVEDQWRRNHA